MADRDQDLGGGRHLDVAEYLAGDRGPASDEYLAGGVGPPSPRAAPAAREEADAHLETCERCRAEVVELREIEDMLRGVPPEALLDGPPEDADLLVARTVREIRGGAARPGRALRPPLLLAAAVSAVVVLAAGVVAGRLSAPDTVPGAPPAVAAPAPGASPTEPVGTPVPGTRFVTAADAGTGARLTAHVVPMAGWVRVHADVEGIPAGAPCRLIVVAADGHQEVAGSWRVSAAGARDGTTLTGAAVVDPASVRSVLVQDTAGKPYVRADV